MPTWSRSEAWAVDQHVKKGLNIEAAWLIDLFRSKNVVKIAFYSFMAANKVSVFQAQCKFWFNKQAVVRISQVSTIKYTRIRWKVCLNIFENSTKCCLISLAALNVYASNKSWPISSYQKPLKTNIQAMKSEKSTLSVSFSIEFWISIFFNLYLLCCSSLKQR